MPRFISSRLDVRYGLIAFSVFEGRQQTISYDRPKNFPRFVACFASPTSNDQIMAVETKKCRVSTVRWDVSVVATVILLYLPILRLHED